MSDRHPPAPRRPAAFEPDAELLLTLRRPRELREAALQRLSRLCACCHRLYLAARLARQICERCSAHVRCGHCGKDFEPGSDSFALLCRACWPSIRELVRSLHERGAGGERAELQHQMQLAFRPRFACRWREEGPTSR